MGKFGISKNGTDTKLIIIYVFSTKNGKLKAGLSWNVSNIEAEAKEYKQLCQMGKNLSITELKDFIGREVEMIFGPQYSVGTKEKKTI